MFVAAVPVPLWTIAPLPFVPLVSVLVHSDNSHSISVCVCPPKLIEGEPVVGEDPIARNTVVRTMFTPLVTVMVLTATQVRLLPVTVG